MNMSSEYQLEEIFLKNAKEKCRIKPGDRVLVGVSGGEDSMVLFSLFLKFQKVLGIELGVCHINHLLRGVESDGDEELVKQTAQITRIDFFGKSVDVQNISIDNKWSLEEAGRRARNEYFKEVMIENSFTKVALAHHMNDQSETVLMNIMRGCGITGLKAMKFKNSYIIRPLLSIPKEEINRYRRQNKISFRLDSTNLEVDFTRNKVRLELLPFIEEQAPAFQENLYKLSQIAKEENDFLEAASRMQFKKLATLYSRGFKVSKDILKISKVLRKRIYMIIYDQLGGEYLEYRYLEEIDEYLFSKDDKKLGLPGEIVVAKESDVFKFKGKSKSVPVEEYSYAAPLEGNCKIMETLSLKFSKVDRFKGNLKDNKNNLVANINCDEIREGLTIRNRRKGDKFKVFGSDSLKRVKELFIDKKIAKEVRDNLPFLVNTENGDIVYIPYLGVSEDYKIIEGVDKILKVEVCLT